MKKFLLVVFIFLCSFNVVDAVTFKGSEYLEGIAYLKNNGSTVQYRNAQVIRSDEYFYEIAYCVEPFKLLVNNSSYTSYDSYNNIFGFDEDKWELAKLYAYYGYGYPKHYESKWISITQMSIWRTLFPNYQFDWIDNVDDKNIIYPYNSELEELKRLVDTHYILPNIGSDIEVATNGDNTFYDSNEVLQYYRIKESDFNVKIDGNNLVITTDDEEKEGTITLQRAFHNYVNSVKYFYSTSSQNVIERGDIPFIYYDLNVVVKNGKAKVNKIDSKTKEKSQGDASLDGAIFELFNQDNEKIDEKEIINNTLEFENLGIGNYYIKEKNAGVGYYLNDKKYEFIIDKDNLDNEITIENDVIKSKVKIYKYYGTKDDYINNTMIKEEGVEFNLYNKNEELIETLITNSLGEIEIELPYGEYMLKQVNSKEGYSKIDDYYFKIDEENSISYDIVLNDLKIEVPNASISIVDILLRGI